jgi:para-aminobenzoate synthetase
MTQPPQGSILFVDAYDSFAENITAMLREDLHVTVTLIKIDCDIEQEFAQSPEDFFSYFDAIVLGPGPGNPVTPTDVGLFSQVWQCAARHHIPVLGICLGFQSLCLQSGLSVARLSLPCHGHAKEVIHTNSDIFTGSGDVVATCYNSLGVPIPSTRQAVRHSRQGSSDSDLSASSDHSVHSSTTVSPTVLQDQEDSEIIGELDILARDRDEYVMAVRHRTLPLHGVQFHPESCKSNNTCHTLIQNWWKTVVQHNKQYRQRVQRPRIQSRKEPDVVLLSQDTRDILAQMLSSARSRNGDLKRTRLHLPAASGVIADLCQRSSPADLVAMLESTKRGRYSIYTFPHEQSFLLQYRSGEFSCSWPASSVAHNRKCRLRREQTVVLLQLFMRSQNLSGEGTCLPFAGGFVGFMSYEFGTSSLELHVNSDDRPRPATPDFSLLWVDRSIIYDNDAGTAYVQSIRDNDSWVEEMTQLLGNEFEAPRRSPHSTAKEKRVEILSRTLPAHERYISQIRDCKSHLFAGNSYELCLTTEATISTSAGPEVPYRLYRSIQEHNPVPYAAYISLDGTRILSSSPEQFLSWSAEQGTIEMVPMKGTVKKDSTMTFAKASEILASAKESAENLMIADLIRHDLYSTVGADSKVEVVKLCDVVESETVYSLVSHIRAHVPLVSDTKQDFLDRVCEMTHYGIRALTRTLPPGSMTGAPKKRSCEILHDLEQRDRGVYSGAFGYIDVCGNGAWSVCIRSAFSNQEDDSIDKQSGEKRRKWRIGAGGAITVLSNEEQEWEEMMTKLNSVLRGFGVE